jgi:nitrate reductase gamma subunit
VDMFTLKSLFRVNRMLWSGGFIMHVRLLLLLVGHVRALTDYYSLWDWLGWGEEETHLFSGVAGTIAGVLFMNPLF